MAGEIGALWHGYKCAPGNTRDLFRHREEDRIPFGARFIPPVKEPLLKQPAPCLLGFLLLYNKAPLFRVHIDHQPSLGMRSHTIHG